MGDATNWNEDGYRNSILQDRELQFRTIFRAVFAPSQNPNPEIIVVASSNGSIAPYSISSCISSHSSNVSRTRNQQPLLGYLVAEPLCSIQGHDGPAYDVKFYGDGEDSILFSCGDDGRIRGWKWKDLLNSDMPIATQGNNLVPVLDLVNPQHKGPWGALSPIPENNAIAINNQRISIELEDFCIFKLVVVQDLPEGSIYSAAGDSCAYCWDVEQGKIKMVFRGHSDYLHCIVASNLSNQILTGSEDGTARLWDCKSGRCIHVIHPQKDKKFKEGGSWVSCVALDASEGWLACGDGSCLSVWNLHACEFISRIATRSPTQDLLFDDNQILAVGAEPVLSRLNIDGMILSQIQCAPQSAFSVSLHPSGVLAVGGYGGLVDVISQFGSHLCTFRCKGV